MTTPRQRLVAKIKAILAKTIDNGATEEEAALALAKAQEIMAAHDVSMSEIEALAEARAEGAEIFASGTIDFYGIKKSLGYGIEKYTKTKCWVSPRTGVTYCGLASDVELAAWLTQHLSQFVVERLNAYRKLRGKNGFGTSRMVASSFVRGCCHRITEKLIELTPKVTTGTALVVCRNALIEKKMEDAGIGKIGKAKNRKRTVDGLAFQHGRKAGEKATIGRPTEGSNPAQARLK